MRRLAATAPLDLRELYGVQVGLVNIARNKETFSVLPIVNWSK